MLVKTKEENEINTDDEFKTGLKHVAIIMDGNRRWAKNRNLPSAAGHKAGVKSLKTTVFAAKDLGIKYLTVYAFSTENWGRKAEEVSFLMTLLAETLKYELNDLHKNNVKIQIIGDLEKLNKDLQKVLFDSMEKTIDNDSLTLQIAINYGSRLEITDAVKKIAADVKNNVLEISDITEQTISSYLYTSDVPDPDLLIRTGGDMRVSNYLLWQIAYSEFYVTNTLWPDFGKDQLIEAANEFKIRERRFGKG